MDDNAEQQRLMELFGYGRAGEPVPVVDPENVKAVWEIGQESVKGYPQGGIMIGREIFRQACKPSANVPAVTYRTRKIDMLQLMQPDVMAPLLRDKSEAVFRAVAEIPMVWIGTDVRHGLPFDRDDFICRVSEA